MTRALGAILAIAVSLAGPAASARADRSLPERVQVAGHELELNGSGRQKVLFFELYDLALYLEEPTASPAEAISSDQPKQLRLKVLRRLPRREIVAALWKGFARSVTVEEMRELEPRLRRMLAKVPNVQRGDELRITYLPGVGTIFQSGAKTRAVIPGKDFADALFSIWLGPNTDTPHLRRALTAPAENQK